MEMSVVERSPEEFQEMFDRLKFMTINRHMYSLSGPIPGHLYLMEAREFVKIGIAINPIRRLKGIQSGCPLPVRLARAWSVSDDYYALLSEKVAHETLGKWRVQGEWFELGAQSVIAVLRDIVEAAKELSYRHSNYKRRIEIGEIEYPYPAQAI
jgi:hypothetical protein